MVLTSLGNALSPASSLITLPIMAHTLGVAGRGAVAAATAPLLFGNAFAAAGLPDAMVYFVAKNNIFAPQLLRRLSALAIVSGLIATGGVMALARPLSGGDPSLARYIMLAATAIPATLIVSVSRGLAVGLQRWRYVRVEQTISSIFSLFAISGLAALGHLTVSLAIAVVTLTPVIGGISYLRFVSMYTNQTAKTTPLASRKILGYAGRSWVGSTSGVAVARLDQAIMTVLSSSYQLGLYAVAVGVSEIPLIVSGAVSLIAFSTDAADRNDERLAMSSRISSFACLILGGSLCLSAPIVFPVVFGAGFAKAVPTTIVLSIAVIAGMPGSVAGSALAARGRPALRSGGLVGAATINVCLLIALVPAVGEIGAAFATLGANLFGNIWALSFLKRIFGVRPISFYGIRHEDWQVLRRLANARLRQNPDTAE